MAKKTTRSEMGERLVKLRNMFGYNQQEIADLIGIKRDTYARYETSTNPPLSVIKKLCEIYNITSDVIFGFSEMDEKKPVSSTSSPLRFSSNMGYSPDSPNEILVMSEDELFLIKQFRKLSQSKQEALIMFINDNE